MKSLQENVREALSKEDISDTDIQKLKELVSAILKEQTQQTEEELAKLLEQKEEIERKIEKKSQQLQEIKYEVFNAIEAEIAQAPQALTQLHQIKLQSIDLYDILVEMVESAIITALEKENEDNDGDVQESLTETIKEITFESIKEGPLNTIRIRKILSTILAVSIEIAEAEPNRAREILGATLKGMKSGLIKSIYRFKKRLAFVPAEAKHILVEDYDTIMEDLHQTDTIFAQVIETQADESSLVIKNTLLEIKKEMKYDFEELVMISKEAAEAMKEKFSSLARIAVKKADSAIHSKQAQEAKKMGIHAFEVAKTALGSAIKSAKDAMDKKKN